MSRSHVVAQSYDTSANNIGRAHEILIIDTILYQVDFNGGKVTELTANVIAESKYTQCDADGNNYFLLDVLVDYH